MAPQPGHAARLRPSRTARCSTPPARPHSRPSAFCWPHQSLVFQGLRAEAPSLYLTRSAGRPYSAHFLRHTTPDPGRAPRTLLVDEAQWPNSEAFEYFRYLWDEPATQLAIVFVGGAGCHTVLRREPMLSSRVFIWQQFSRLTLKEVKETIPLLHPIWAAADPSDIAFADSHAAHGNFRAWAQLTAHARTAPARTDRPRIDHELLRWAFSRLA